MLHFFSFFEITSHKIASYLPFFKIKIAGYLFIGSFMKTANSLRAEFFIYFGQNQDQRLFESEFLKIWELVVLK